MNDELLRLADDIDRMIIGPVELINRLRVLAAQADTSRAEVQGEPVAWWNGIRPTLDDSFAPSLRWDREDTWHDIPMYAGFNPIHTHPPRSVSVDALRAKAQGWKDRATFLRAHDGRTTTNSPNKMCARELDDCANELAKLIAGMEDNNVLP